jgi:hypothetical protein
MLDGNHLRPLRVARVREEHHHAVVGEHARVARPDRQEPAVGLLIRLLDAVPLDSHRARNIPITMRMMIATAKAALTAERLI